MSDNMKMGFGADCVVLNRVATYVKVLIYFQRKQSLSGRSRGFLGAFLSLGTLGNGHLYLCDADQLE